MSWSTLDVGCHADDRLSGVMKVAIHFRPEELSFKWMCGRTGAIEADLGPYNCMRDQYCQAKTLTKKELSLSGSCSDLKT